ncbi:MAG: TonB-dependent receptor [Pseudomonadota bacterium]
MRIVSSFMSVAVVAIANSALAQSQNPETGLIELDPLVVTARKREQPITDVPASVSVVRPEEIASAGGNDVRGVIERTPNASFIGLGFPGNNSINLRGLGGLATFGPYDAAVSVTLDEHVIPLRSFDAMLLDAERVEVLKGPQGTLYGRSSIGGAINIVTREMTEEWTGDFGAEGGENGHITVQGAGGGAISDSLLVRGAVRFTDFDGDVPNTLTDEDTNQAETFAGRASAKWLFNDTGFVRLTYQAEREDFRPTGDILLTDPRFPIAAQSGLSKADRDTDRVTARIENAFSGFKLVALGAYERTKIGSDFDLTDSILIPAAFGIPARFTTDPTNDRSITATDEETISFEVRLQSDEGQRFEWLVGASYLDLTFDRNLSRRSIIPSFNIDEVSSNSNTTIGTFGDVTWNVSERFSVGAGLRVARDELDYRGTTDFFGALAGTPRFSETDRFDDNYVVGNVNIAYRFADHLVYARAARGYASGGYGEFAANALVGQPIDPFEPSTSNSFEVGIRGGSPALFYSAAAFYNDVSDGQTYQFDATTFRNVAENLDFTSYGIEGEVSAELTDWARLDLAVGLQQAEFDDVPRTALSGAMDGDRVPLTPRFTLSAALSGDIPVVDFGPVDRVSYLFSVNHVGDRAADPANSTIIDSYTILDARIGAGVGNVEVYGFGTNLTDEVAVLYSQNFGTPTAPVPTANVNRGRVLGLGVSAKF